MTTIRTITESQVRFVSTLASERSEAIMADRAMLDRYSDAVGGIITVGQASTLIDALKSLPRNAVPAAAKAVPGYYATATKFVCVVATKDGERTYAKTLEFHTGEDGAQRPSWDYAPGVGKTLAGMTPLTPEQVREFGYAHGFCMKCCKPLTDAKSVERGAGPVCWKKLVGSHAALAAA